jgi:ATP-dependent helicase/DNAse subunit B
LERFHGCPFAYLLQDLLALPAEDYAEATSDPRELGAIMHRVFERFYETLADGGERQLESSQHSRYGALMTETAERVCREWERNNAPPFAPLWLELQERIRELALRFLEVELEQMPGERVADVELRLEAPFEADPEVLLVGKIDRVSVGQFGTTVVDYKKKKTPSEREIFAPDATSLQIPFYLCLMQAQGRPVQRAAYYSIEEGRYRFVLGDRNGAAVPTPLLGETLQGLEQRIREMARRIREGDYTIPRAEASACRSCDLPELCRRRYLMGGTP